MGFDQEPLIKAPLESSEKNTFSSLLEFSLLYNTAGWQGSSAMAMLPAHRCTLCFSDSSSLSVTTNQLTSLQRVQGLVGRMPVDFLWAQSTLIYYFMQTRHSPGIPLLDSKEPAGLGGTEQSTWLFLFYLLHLKDTEGEMCPAQGRECPLLSRRSPAPSYCTEPCLPLLLSDSKPPEIKLNSSISCPWPPGENYTGGCRSRRISQHLTWPPTALGVSIRGCSDAVGLEGDL